MNEQNTQYNAKRKSNTVIIILLVILIIGVIGIITLQLTGYSVFNNNDEEIYTEKEIDFRGCENGKEKECTKYIMLDGKKTKITSVLEKTETLDANKDKSISNFTTKRWNIKIDDKKVFDSDDTQFSYYNGYGEKQVDTRTYTNIGSFLVHLRGGVSSSGDYQAFNYYGTYNFDLPNDFWTKSYSLEIINDTTIKIVGTHISSHAGGIYINGVLAPCPKDVPDEYIIERDFEITKIGNNDYKIEKVLGSEVYGAEIKQTHRFDYCKNS